MNCLLDRAIPPAPANIRIAPTNMEPLLIAFVVVLVRPTVAILLVMLFIVVSSLEI